MDPSIEGVTSRALGAFPVGPSCMFFVVVAGYSEFAGFTALGANSWLSRGSVGLLCGRLWVFGAWGGT
jgi:hypothetical protein